MEEIQESTAEDTKYIALPKCLPVRPTKYFADTKGSVTYVQFDNNPKDQYAGGCHNLIVHGNYRNANTYFTNAANVQPKQGETLTPEEQKKRNEIFLESNYILGVWNLFGIGKEKAVPQNIQKSINCLMKSAKNGHEKSLELLIKIINCLYQSNKEKEINNQEIIQLAEQLVQQLTTQNEEQIIQLVEQNEEQVIQLVLQ